MNKNDIVRLTITDMTSEGEGIGKVDAFPFFVKDAIIGDVIDARITKLKKNYGYARLEAVITPSHDRVPAKCPIARACGGCQLQEMDYKAQLIFKENLVRNNLKRLGGNPDYEMLPICGMKEPYYYRNKAQFPVGADKNGNIKIGFYAGRTHSIIETKECFIGSPINSDIVNIVREFMERYKVLPYDEISGTGLMRHILIRVARRTGEIMVCLVINGSNIPKSEELVKMLQKVPGLSSVMINVNTKNTNVILSGDTRLLYGRDYIEDYIGDVKYHISANSFFQVNPIQTEKLYSKALEFADLTGSETVWDLYCGIGTISLFLARKAQKVYGVEIIPQAIEDAVNNAKINNITNARFFTGKSEEILPAYYEKHKDEYADCIVVDPPRKGCDEKLLSTIVAMSPEKIVYVSCDSATLARDVKYLTEHGYELKKVQCFDQFCHTVHVEVVSLLQKVSNTRERTNTLDVEMEDYHRSKNRTGVTAG